MTTKIGGFGIIQALRDVDTETQKSIGLDDGVMVSIFGKEVYSEQISDIRELVLGILNKSNIGLNSRSDGEQFYFPVVNRFYLQDLMNEPWITPASIFTILLALTH